MSARARSERSVAPACAHFGVCGGCTALDVPIDVQLDAKRARVEALLAPFLEPGVEVATAPAPQLPLHTRTRLSWPVRPGPDGAPRLGMFAAGSHRIVGIRECRIQDPALTRLQMRAERVFATAGLAPYDERTGAGVVRAFHARLVAGSGELLLGLTTCSGPFERGAAVADALLDAAAGLRDARGRRSTPVGVVRSILDAPGNALLGPRQLPLRGRDFQVDRVAGLEVRVSFGSFYQAHRNAEAVLFRPALEMLGPVAGERVVDGYGGVGAFALRLARAGAARVELVEADRRACADARDNARRNALPQLEVFEQPFDAAAVPSGPDALVVDPPRKGLGDGGVARVLALAPARLVYVSCGPEALARDLGVLCGAGYRVVAVRIADLFPHTAHVETLCLLRR